MIHWRLIQAEWECSGLSRSRFGRDFPPHAGQQQLPAERCFEINPVNEAYNPEKMIINAEKATTEILQKIC